MGTRGFVTFVIDGQEKTAYSHCDSYPERLGLSVLRWARVQHENLPLLAVRARSLRVVDPDGKPTAREARDLNRFAEGPGRPGTWYHLRLGFPRSPQALWGYVIDVDAGRLEVYRGGQREAHDRGRFARLGPADLGSLTAWPPALVASWPFGALPADADGFLTACHAPGGDE